MELTQLDRLQALAATAPGRNEAALAEAQAILSALDTGVGFRSEKIGCDRSVEPIEGSATCVLSRRQ